MDDIVKPQKLGSVFDNVAGLSSLVRMTQALQIFTDTISHKMQEQGHTLNSAQILMLWAIGNHPGTLFHGDLRSLGYYTGSNSTYNTKKLAEDGYILSTRNKTDRRRVGIGLTAKGREAANIINSEIIDFENMLTKRFGTANLPNMAALALTAEQTARDYSAGHNYKDFEINRSL